MLNFNAQSHLVHLMPTTIWCVLWSHFVVAHHYTRFIQQSRWQSIPCHAIALACAAQHILLFMLRKRLALCAYSMVKHMQRSTAKFTQGDAICAPSNIASAWWPTYGVRVCANARIYVMYSKTHRCGLLNRRRKLFVCFICITHHAIYARSSGCIERLEWISSTSALYQSLNLIRGHLGSMYRTSFYIDISCQQSIYTRTPYMHTARPLNGGGARRGRQRIFAKHALRAMHGCVWRDYMLKVGLVRLRIAGKWSPFVWI